MKPMSEVVEGLDTTSDKIRALLREGYLRADIARFLDVRYQHVRGVAVAAGIDGGLQRGIEVLVKPKPIPKAPNDVAIELLIDAGFTLLGSWKAAQTGIALSTKAPKDPGVYAFVVKGMIKYIGLTKRGFHRRMYNYQKPGATQSTSIRINQVIAEHIASGEPVEIYLAVPPALQWNGLPIHSAAGLEAGLIDMIQPPWNKMGISSG